MKILVLDVGGSHVKCLASGRKTHVEFKSGPKLTPREMVKQVLKITRGWRFDAVSIGYPGVVHRGKPRASPTTWVRAGSASIFARHSLARSGSSTTPRCRRSATTRAERCSSWDWARAWARRSSSTARSRRWSWGTCATRSAATTRTISASGGASAWETRSGAPWWRRSCHGFRKALLPDYIVLGGGNAAHLKRLPPHTFRGDNSVAFTGGFRLWERAHSRKRAHASAR
jgi:hypothetical protein